MIFSENRYPLFGSCASEDFENEEHKKFSGE